MRAPFSGATSFFLVHLCCCPVYNAQSVQPACSRLAGGSSARTVEIAQDGTTERGVPLPRDRRRQMELRRASEEEAGPREGPFACNQRAWPFVLRLYAGGTSESRNLARRPRFAQPTGFLPLFFFLFFLLVRFGYLCSRWNFFLSFFFVSFSQARQCVVPPLCQGSPRAQLSLVLVHRACADDNRQCNN